MIFVDAVNKEDVNFGLLIFLFLHLINFFISDLLKLEFVGRRDIRVGNISFKIIHFYKVNFTSLIVFDLSCQLNM